MAYDKVIDSTVLDSNLLQVANAIREKGGTSAELSFPSGFVNAISQLSSPDAISGRIEGNNIILSVELPDGTYNIIHEGVYGVTSGGELIIGAKYTNLLSSALGSDGAVYNGGKGYCDGYYLNNKTESSISTHFVTGFIPYTKQNAKDKLPIYIKGCDIDVSNTYTRISQYPNYNDTSGANPQPFNKVLSSGSAMAEVTKLGDKYYVYTPTTAFWTAAGWNNYDMKYIRMSLPGTGAGVIITVNEPIE